MSTTTHKIINFVCYITVCAGMVALGAGESDLVRGVGLTLILVAFVINDVTSFDQGIRTGINISNDALKRVCDEKQITITKK